MPAFATVEELATLLGRTFTAAEEATAEMLLDQATAAVQGYTGQQFTAGTTMARFKVIGGRVRLPQRPVTAIDTVEDVEGRTVLFTWDAGSQVYLSPSMQVANGPDGWGSTRYGGPSYVEVTYDHGYEAIPVDVKAVVLQVAGRALGTPADDGGVQSESIGSYSYTVGTIAAAGAVGLLPAEQAVLDRYRAPAGPAVMTRR